MMNMRFDQNNYLLDMVHQTSGGGVGGGLMNNDQWRLKKKN
jgi:hypothetical protein